MKNFIFPLLLLLIVSTGYSQDQIFTNPNPSSEMLLASNTNEDISYEDIYEEEKIYEVDMKANCFCRVGEDRGKSVKEYNRPYIKGIAMNKTYKFQNKKNEDDCSRRCSSAAFKYFRSLNKNQICAILKKSGTTTIRAYSKVGTRPWTVCQTLGTVKCCSSGGGVTCPKGWTSESTNFPGYCSKKVCQPQIKGDRRLYNENGSTWGFIWKDWIYQLRKGKKTGIVWSSCK